MFLLSPEKKKYYQFFLIDFSGTKMYQHMNCFGRPATARSQIKPIFATTTTPPTTTYAVAIGNKGPWS
jgi:hypothetical protein